jgi:biopolymer transport protein ExbB
MEFVASRWGQGIGKLLICLLLTTVVAGVFFSVAPQTAVAQDQAPDEAPKEVKGPVNPIVHFIVSIGLVFGIIFLALSIGTVALIIILFMDLRMGDAISPVFVDEFTNMVNKRQFKQAYELAKTDTSYLSRVLSAGMGRLQYGIEDAREAMFSQGELIRSGKDAMISYLSAVGTLGPLLGLVGTVSGMIGAFRKLGSSAKAPDASELAGEISHALVVTLVGVAISCPAIFFFTFFKNRLGAISHSVTTLADDLLTQMYHNSKKPAGAPAAAGSQAVTARG